MIDSPLFELVKVSDALLGKKTVPEGKVALAIEKEDLAGEEVAGGGSVLRPGVYLVAPAGRFSLSLLVKDVETKDGEKVRVSVRMSASAGKSTLDAALFRSELLGARSAIDGLALGKLFSAYVRRHLAAVIGTLEFSDLADEKESVAERIRALVEREGEKCGLLVETVEEPEIGGGALEKFRSAPAFRPCPSRRQHTAL